MGNGLTTAGNLLFEDVVPQQFREGHEGALDAGSIKSILQRVADQEPHRYRDISHKLLQLGMRASTETDTSFGLEDLHSPIDKASLLRQVEAQEDGIFANKSLTPKQRENELIKLYAHHSGKTPGLVFDAAMARGSNLAKMVASGARGSKGQLNSNIGADWLVLDSNSNPVPIPIKSSYAEGMSPGEYFAASYGTRLGLTATKFSVQNAGYLSKQLASAAHDQVVTEDDCGTDRGIPTDADDKDNIGAVLARPVAGHPGGTVISSHTLRDFKHKGVKSFMVRSPLTCNSPNGLCSTCAGLRERGHTPALMENVGLASASAMGEPLAQSTLSTKHAGGVASSTSKAVTGFKAIDQLVQVPEVFQGGAVVANRDGAVTRIEPAPQGGNYVHVEDEPHYVGQGVGLKVKRGDRLEAGDILSEGVPNPADIVKHKGIGEGRLYFVKAMKRAFEDNGMQMDRRNLEVIGRALVNHVKIEDPEGLGNHLPDDVIEYNQIERDYQPKDKVLKLHPDKATDHYLAKPALHYTIGTRITPRVAKQLSDNGEKEIEVTQESPGFSPEMQRVADIPGFKQDWLAQFAGSHLKKRTLDAVHSGDAVSDIHGVSFISGLAKGVEFGRPPKGIVGY